MLLLSSLSSSSSSSYFAAVVGNERPPAGTTLHAHPNAWNALFYGRKRWFLVPPHLAQSAFALARKNTTDPMATWVREDYPKLRHYLYECIQEAGDVVCVTVCDMRDDMRVCC